MPKRNPRPDAERLIHIRLSTETHKRLRIRAAELDTSLQEWVKSVIENGLKPSKRKGTRK